MGYAAKAVANHFLVQHKHERVSPLKLHKLVYVSHGWHLALFDELLVDDEYAEAWQYGPIFPSLYYEFKEFGNNPITRLASDQAGINDPLDTPLIRPVDVRTSDLLLAVWRGYGHYTALQLSSLTHSEGTPWHVTRQQKPGRRNEHIKNEVLRAYYKRLWVSRNQQTDTA